MSAHRRFALAPFGCFEIIMAVVVGFVPSAISRSLTWVGIAVLAASGLSLRDANSDPGRPMTQPVRLIELAKPRTRRAGEAAAAGGGRLRPILRRSGR
jgi:hypothetical protein